MKKMRSKEWKSGWTAAVDKYRIEKYRAREQGYGLGYSEGYSSGYETGMDDGFQEGKIFQTAEDIERIKRVTRIKRTEKLRAKAKK